MLEAASAATDPASRPVRLRRAAAAVAAAASLAVAAPLLPTPTPAASAASAVAAPVASAALPAAASLSSVAAARASGPVPHAAYLTAPSTAPQRSHATVQARVVDVFDDPVASQQVRFERAEGSRWTTIRTVVTGPAGRATIRPVVKQGRNRIRAVVLGTRPQVVAGPATVTGGKTATRLTITAPARVVDERTVRVVGTWRTADGRPVRGRVSLHARSGRNGSWRLVTRRHTGPKGRVTFTLKPRIDTRYKLWGAPGATWRGDMSGVRYVDNRPPGKAWTPPAGAPRPRALPKQPRAVGGGVNIVTTRIPDATWRRMSGVTWRPGCPVGRSQLRLIRANYWGFDGYRYRGELVVNAAIAHKFRGALRDLYAGRFPIRAMHPVERFGYSPVSGGGNDYVAMEHDNTSAFNCRWVTGNPGVRSPHATGRAFDLNTFENPYRSNWGWLPSTWWVGRADARVAWRTASHPVVRLMARNGFRWTYGVADAQHFDG